MASAMTTSKIIFFLFALLTEAFVSHRGRRRFGLQAFSQQLNTYAKEQLVEDFSQKVQQAVEDKSFVSLILRGSSKKKKGADPALLRGSIRQVQGRLIEVKQGLALQLTLKYHGATDIAKNLCVDEISERLPELILRPLASEWGIEAAHAQPIQAAEVKTLTTNWELRSLGNSPSLVERKVKSMTEKDAVQPGRHDRAKQVPISTTADFLQALGVTKPDGKPRPGMSSKLRQCNKFVEIVSGLIEKTLTREPQRRIRVVDMGCGRGYLTFALHSYLCKKYENVSSLGIDVRPKLVAEISGIAQSLSGDFDTLGFEKGTIEAIVAGDTSVFNDQEGVASLDILIALHACDTATDDAIWSGVSQGADIIVAAPCCHKEIRPQVNAHVTANGDAHPLADILKHAVYRERMSETITDSLRALLLERAGYNVQVFEFIGGEHTSKNVMITAIKAKRDPDSANISERIRSQTAFYGITHQKLAEWMDEDLSAKQNQSGKRHKGPTMTTQMPRS